MHLLYIEHLLYTGSKERLTKVDQVRSLSSIISFGAKRTEAVMSSGSHLNSILVLHMMAVRGWQSEYAHSHLPDGGN